MGVSKVVYGNEIVMDISGDSVTAGTLLSGETAHGADGEAITGTAIKIVVTADDTTPPSDTNALWVYPDTMQDLSEVSY